MVMAFLPKWVKRWLRPIWTESHAPPASVEDRRIATVATPLGDREISLGHGGGCSQPHPRVMDSRRQSSL